MTKEEIENLLKSVKAWWDTTNKDTAALERLLNKTTEIDGYTFFNSSSTNAYILAKKYDINTSIIDCGYPDEYPDNMNEFYRILTTKLNSLTGGKKSKMRKTRKSRKIRRKKSIRNRKSYFY